MRKKMLVQADSKNQFFTDILHKIHWQPAWRLSHQLTTLEKTCVLNKASMTRFLQQRAKGKVRAKVLQQQWQAPFVDEMQLLNLIPRTQTLVREVELQTQQQTVIFARVVIPHQTFEGDWGGRLYYYLNEKPIGLLLFKDPHWSRSEFELAQIELTREQATILAIDISSRKLWGRRSVFYYGSQPLLITEIFSPLLFD